MVLLFFLMLAIGSGLGFSDFPRVRLVGSHSRCKGRVELWKDEQWGTVCDDHWTKEAVAIVCQELQCGPVVGVRAGRLYSPKAQEDQLMWNLICQGTEESLADCKEDVVKCNDHEEDAGAICEETQVLDGLRLVDGPGPCIGRVEVKYAGKWGTVCNTGWTLQDAKVLCRELGCGRPILTKGSCNKDQEGTGNIWPGQVECQGSEASLNDCPFALMGKNNCSHKDDTWVQCEERFALRLVDGGSNCSGRLEVLHKGIWGSVCNDGWGAKEDQVVCRELNCGKAESQKSRARKSFGHGKGLIWLDDVHCKGKETSLEQCKHRFWGYHDCTHREDVSVKCFGMPDEQGEPRQGWET
ncbi:LOW QUALITY PROTEIN: CD5 antigen-like [Trichosurus vulpecula]|uniref:LOW QUALITY PROTEIN: CD5 antigen-like n=1 Tax=Trichosurus vulpecula TaxID=9337 RepID=UPI00186AF3EE|nr:LOW QUALITY PROTEIN: CD5 antigen-like [Trichosurus vulpecula]